VLGPYRTFQIANAYLEAATGYGFSALKTADPLKKAEAEHALTALQDDLCLHIRHQDS
jgi:DNA/RNA endonuclease G (NUC1)